MLGCLPCCLFSVSVFSLQKLKQHLDFTKTQDYELTADDVHQALDKGSKLPDEALEVVVVIFKMLVPFWAPITAYAKKDTLPMAVAAPWWLVAGGILRALGLGDQAPTLAIEPGSTERVVPFNTWVSFSQHDLSALSRLMDAPIKKTDLRACCHGRAARISGRHIHGRRVREEG